MTRIADFYNNFMSYQIKSGINDRIYNLKKRLDKLGIKNHSSILEIGCGIGSMTYLLTRKIRKAKIESIDISPESVNYAKQHLKRPNLQLTSSDVMQYKPVNQSFDYILMFDALEHIPIENHALLFSKIAGWMNDQSMLLINLPNPEYINYDQKYNAKELQEIDQPIYLDHLLSIFSKSDLKLDYYESYSVWVKNDYYYCIVKKKSEFKMILLSDERNTVEKTKIWLNRKWRKIKYRYPK